MVFFKFIDPRLGMTDGETIDALSRSSLQ